MGKPWVRHREEVIYTLLW